MSFPAYGSYKDSGVEWLGEIPAHWTIMPLKRDLDFLTSGSRGWADHYADDGALFIRIGNLTRDRLTLDLDDIQRVNVPPGAEGERTQVQPGDLLFSITAYLGSVAVVPEKLETAYVSQHVALARLRAKRLLPAWVGYVALSWLGKTYLETRGYGGTKIQLSLDDIAEMVMTAPPLAEQNAIAAFLDRETAKIDALVEAQRRLIELLKEKRQAVISHAVTKGLDPSAPMKDSGVEWLGQVPAHWEVLPVKRVTRSIEQGWSPQCENYPVQGADEWGVLKVGCVNGGRFAPGENKTLPAELEPLPELGIRSGDLLVSRANTRELVGSAAVAEEAHPNLLLCDKLYRLRLDLERCAPAFLALFLGCRVARQQIELAATGASSSMLNIGQAVILELPLALPPPEEQAATLRWLKVELEKLDSLAANAQALTDVLQERRAALISAAVTGKIDVRGLVESAEAA